MQQLAIIDSGTWFACAWSLQRDFEITVWKRGRTQGTTRIG